MMNEMMKNCCGEDGKPDFEKMKRLMEDCACGCNPPMTRSQSAQTASKETKESKGNL